MASKYWLKLYYEVLDDPKIGRLPVNLKWRFIECLLLAGEQNKGGFLPPLPDISWRLRVEDETVRRDFSQLAMSHLLELRLDSDGDECWFVTNFEKRQAPSDAAQRMREYRRRQRKEKEPKRKEKDLKTKEKTDTDTYRAVTHVTKGNGFVQGHPVFEIPSALDTDEFERAWIDWYKHRLEIGKPLTQMAGDKMLSRLAEKGVERAVAAIDFSISRSYKNIYEPKEFDRNGRHPTPEPDSQRKGGAY